MSSASTLHANVRAGIQTVLALFQGWLDRRMILGAAHQRIVDYYQQLNAQCGDAEGFGKPVPDVFIFPILEPAVQEHPEAGKLWDLAFAEGEIDRLGQMGLLTVRQADVFQDELRQRINGLRHRLILERTEGARSPRGPVPPRYSEYAHDLDAADEVAPAIPRRNLLEMLLDPRSIQWLLGLGGALMVVGVVLLLWLNDYFQPPLVAAILGVANAGLLAGGWFLMLKTRYQTAGRALTLLACLVMPLNLWYYDVHFTWLAIDTNLWVAALVISTLYLVSALVLREETFVYIFLAGLTMTGMLILAGQVQRFWEIAAPATFLVVLGLLSIHVERAFPPADGPFSRRRFGMAFFWSGHALLAAGLLLVLGAQLWAFVLKNERIVREFDLHGIVASPIADQMRWLAILLVLGGTYAYIYSDLVVRKVGLYTYLAAFTLLWAVVLGLQEFQLRLGMDALIATLACLALLVHLGQATVFTGSQYTRSFPVLGLLLGMLPVVLGLWVYIGALDLDLQHVWNDAANNPPRWTYVGAMLLTAISSRVGAFVYRHRQPILSACYFFAAAAATIVGAVALLATLGQTTWPHQAPFLMVIPSLYLIAAHLYRGHSAEKPLVWVSHAATGVMLLTSLLHATPGFIAGRSQDLNIYLVIFFAEAALYYVLVTYLRKESWAVYPATLMACAAVWQGLTWVNVPGEYYAIVYGAAGVVLLIDYRLDLVKGFGIVGLARATFQAANTLLGLALTASLLLGASRILGHKPLGEILPLTSGMAILAILAAVIVARAEWRRVYVVAAIAQMVLFGVAMVAHGSLNPWQKAEICCVIAGILLLVGSHIGWFREKEGQNDLVTFGLLFGSLLAGVPLMIATVSDRYFFEGKWYGVHIFNELGFLAVSILLLITGMVFRLRSTAIIGAVLATVYFVTLVVLIPWRELADRGWAIGLALALGGGTLFGLGLILSLFRDRILQLPERIRNREGVFRVLSWR